MNINEFFQQVLFSIGEKDIKVINIALSILVIVVAFFLQRILVRRVLPHYFGRETIKTENQAQVKSIIRGIIYIIALIGVIWCMDLDYILTEARDFKFRISTVLEAILIIQIARLFDWIASKILAYNYHRSRNVVQEIIPPKEETDKAPEKGANRTVRYVLYILSLILIFKIFALDNYTLFSYGEYELKISNVFSAILVIMIAQLVAWILTQLVLYSYYHRQEVNMGSQYAINQLVKYVIYVIAIFMVIDSLGVQMTVVWGGLTALLIGVGLGLQQTFTDLFAGILLLFDGTVEVGQIIEVNGIVGKVNRIGMRTSLIETRYNVTMIVPNSKLISDSVTNWSHLEDKVRFDLSVGVAYGSDTHEVKKILLQVAKENVYVLEKPHPMVRFTDFADSSLNFQLLFWSRNFIIIEDIKSDLRFAIDDAFRENEIQIPFPQRDLWFRNKPEK